MRLGILINPSAGHVSNAELLRDRLQALLKGRAEAVFHLPQDNVSAEQAARGMLEQGCGRIAVAGGDGTIHRVLPALAGTQIPLGILPMGTVNLLALEWGIPRAMARALDIILAGKTRRIDLGMANGRYFFHVLGAGFDAQLMNILDSRAKKFWRHMLLPWVGLLALHRSPAQAWEIICDGKRWDAEPYGRGVIVANGSTYGSPYRLSRDMASDDGCLDVFVVRSRPFRELLLFCLGVLTRGLLHAPMPHIKAKTVRIVSQKPMPVQTDGEVYLQTPVEIQIRPKALSIVIP